jgi:hypothetical protein
LLSDRLFPGNVGVAEFILDHGSGNLLGRPARLAAPWPGENKADEEIDEIGDEEIKNQLEETGDHLLTLPDLPDGVNSP